ncbi:MAG: hypothetical protein JSS07_08130 [Proteobacteria bacterium]|nr:hypothetical protein [Pseudomonadota bacterium]
MYTLHIKMLDGSTLPLMIEPNISLITLKRQIEAEFHIPVAQQRLIHAGRLFADDQLILTPEILHALTRNAVSFHLVIRNNNGLQHNVDVNVNSVFDESKSQLQWAILHFANIKGQKEHQISLGEKVSSLHTLPYHHDNAMKALEVFKRRYAKNAKNAQNNAKPEKACLALVALSKGTYDKGPTDEIYQGLEVTHIFPTNCAPIQYVPIFALTEGNFAIFRNGKIQSEKFEQIETQFLEILVNHREYFIPTDEQQLKNLIESQDEGGFTPEVMAQLATNTTLTVEEQSRIILYVKRNVNDSDILKASLEDKKQFCEAMRKFLAKKPIDNFNENIKEMIDLFKIPEGREGVLISSNSHFKNDMIRTYYNQALMQIVTMLNAADKIQESIRHRQPVNSQNALSAKFTLNVEFIGGKKLNLEKELKNEMELDNHFGWHVTPESISIVNATFSNEAKKELNKVILNLAKNSFGIIKLEIQEGLLDKETQQQINAILNRNRQFKDRQLKVAVASPLMGILVNGMILSSMPIILMSMALIAIVWLFNKPIASLYKHRILDPLAGGIVLTLACASAIYFGILASTITLIAGVSGLLIHRLHEYQIKKAILKYQQPNIVMSQNEMDSRECGIAAKKGFTPFYWRLSTWKNPGAYYAAHYGSQIMPNDIIQENNSRNSLIM